MQERLLHREQPLSFYLVLQLLSYQRAVSFLFQRIATTIILYEVVVYTHVLRHTVKVTIPLWVRVCALKYRLSPAVYDTEAVEIVVSVEEGAVFIVNAITIRRECGRQQHGTTCIRA